MDEKVIELEPLAVKKRTAARMLDASETTIWRLCRSGALTTVKIAGGDERVTVESLRRLVGAA